MTQGRMYSPNELVDRLIQIFPFFAEEWDDGEAFGYDKASYTFHSVFLAFGPSCYDLIVQATAKEIEDFCTLINDAIESGGDLENAVSTCFLEHASQLKVRKFIRPYLSGKAKSQLR